MGGLGAMACERFTAKVVPSRPLPATMMYSARCVQHAATALWYRTGLQILTKAMRLGDAEMSSLESGDEWYELVV